MKYQIRGLSKFAEVDDFEQGCQSEGGYNAEVDIAFSGKTPQEVIKKVCDFIGINEDAVETDACEEEGRIDFAATECEDGTIMNDQEAVEWKAGTRKAFYCIYTGYLEQVTTVSAATA